MNEDFRNEYIEINSQALMNANLYYFSHMEELAALFGQALADACERVAQMQAQGYGDIEYMEVTMLRTRLLMQDYRIPIMVYGSEWYADPDQIQAGEISGDEIFRYYKDMMKETESLVKKYRAKLPERMLENCQCMAAGNFWKYADMACRRAVMGFSAGEMHITDAFCVRVCEYMGYGRVCRRYTPEMEPDELKKWFDKKEETAYRFRDFRGCDLSGCDFRGLDLSGCDFSGCILDGCNFEEANLDGTWFDGSSMKEACLSGAWVSGARFDGANLERAVLAGAHSVCKINDSTWIRPDREWVSFVGCGLHQANLTFSAMEEADFRGADLTGAMMNAVHKEYYELDGVQQGQVCFCEY